MAERGAWIHYTTWVHRNQQSIQFRTVSKIWYWRCALRATRQMYGKVTESTLRCHMLAAVHHGRVHSFRRVSSCLWANSMNRMLRLWASVFCEKTSGYAVGNAHCLDSKCFALNDWKFFQMPLPVISVVKGGQIFPSSLCSERTGISP